MPFTPFHFGLGLAAKGAAPRRFFLLYFVILQVVIDLETLTNLILRRDRVHAFLHTFLGATLLGLTAALPALSGYASKLGPGRFGRFALLLGTTWFATWSHVVLDGIMHRDIRPFWPFTDRNPLRGVIALGSLHAGLVVLGLIGLAVLGLRWPSAEGARP